MASMRSLLLLAAIAGSGVPLGWAAHPHNTAAAQRPMTLVPILGVGEHTPQVSLATIQAGRFRLQLGEAANTIVAAPDRLNAAAGPESLTCPPDKSGLTDGFQMFTYSLTTDTAVSLSYFAQGDVSASDKIILYEFMWYKDLMGTNGTVEGRCGAGVNLALKVSNLQAGVSLSLAAVAASAQLGQTTNQYKLGTFGLSGSAIDAAIPSALTVGKFDTDAYAALMQSITAIQTAYKSTDSQAFVVTPRLVAVSFPTSNPSLDQTAAVQIFALNQISLGKTCRDARSALPGRDRSTDTIVEQMYSAVTGGDCSLFSNPAPSADSQNREKTLLQTYGITLQ